MTECTRIIYWRFRNRLGFAAGDRRRKQDGQTGSKCGGERGREYVRDIAYWNGAHLFSTVKQLVIGYKAFPYTDIKPIVTRQNIFVDSIRGIHRIIDKAATVLFGTFLCKQKAVRRKWFAFTPRDCDLLKSIVNIVRR